MKKERILPFETATKLSTEEASSISGGMATGSGSVEVTFNASAGNDVIVDGNRDF